MHAYCSSKKNCVLGRNLTEMIHIGFERCSFLLQFTWLHKNPGRVWYMIFKINVW